MEVTDPLPPCQSSSPSPLAAMVVGVVCCPALSAPREGLAGEVAPLPPPGSLPALLPVSFGGGEVEEGWGQRWQLGFHPRVARTCATRRKVLFSFRGIVFHQVYFFVFN